MAKRRRAVAYAAPRTNIIPFRAPAPVVITRTRTVHKKAKRRHHRHSPSGGSMSGKEIGAHFAGGAGLGYIDKLAIKIPTIPAIGRAGSIAGIAYLVARNSSGGIRDIAVKVCKAAVTIAGYEFGSKGTISGVAGVRTV